MILPNVKTENKTEIKTEIKTKDKTENKTKTKTKSKTENKTESKSDDNPNWLPSAHVTSLLALLRVVIRHNEGSLIAHVTSVLHVLQDLLTCSCFTKECCCELLETVADLLEASRCQIGVMERQRVVAAVSMLC